MTAKVSYAEAVVKGTGAGYSGTPDWRPGSKLHIWAGSKGISDPRHVFNIARKIARRGTTGESGNINGNQRYDGGDQNWLSTALREASK